MSVGIKGVKAAKGQTVSPASLLAAVRLVLAQRSRRLTLFSVHGSDHGVQNCVCGGERMASVGFNSFYLILIAFPHEECR